MRKITSLGLLFLAILLQSCYEKGDKRKVNPTLILYYIPDSIGNTSSQYGYALAFNNEGYDSLVSLIKFNRHFYYSFCGKPHFFNTSGLYDEKLNQFYFQLEFDFNKHLKRDAVAIKDIVSGEHARKFIFPCNDLLILKEKDTLMTIRFESIQFKAVSSLNEIKSTCIEISR